MNRSLTIGLLDWTPGWEMLLEWTGVPRRPLHNMKDLTVEQLAVVIVNRPLWREECEAVEGFVRSGGALLDIGRFLPRVAPETIRRRWVSSLFPDQSDPLFSGLPLLDLEGRGASPRQASDVEGLLGFVPLGKGIIASLGVDPGPMMEDHRFRMKRFPGVDARHPAERVSRLSKGEIGLLLDRIFLHLFAEQGLPLLRKRRFPDDAENIFCFRVDSDYGSIDQINSLYDLARSTSAPMTWFLHTEGHAGRLARFAEFEGQEIALHCARHRTFPDKERNRRNIADARRALREVGLSAVGYAAPTGLWHHNLAEVIDEEGFLYSSEFTLACDAFPFYPILPLRRRVNTDFYRALQVPIHPISVGNLARVGISDQRMIDYYREVIDRKFHNGESLIFYHHPTHERWNVVEGIIEAAGKKGARPMTFRAWADWWKRREDVSFEAKIEGGRLELRSWGGDLSVRTDVFFPDGTVGRLAEDGGYEISEIDRLQSPEIYRFGGEERIDHLRRFSFTVARRALRDNLTRVRR